MTLENKILIVDDEEIGRETLESLLIKEPYFLLFASSAYEMLEIARKNKPDLILLDVMMPGMDGFEACREIRKDPVISETPVILVTALDDKQSLIKGIEAGADDFVSKPFDRIELRARVKTITRLNRYRKLVNERHKTEWIVNQANEGFLVINTEKKIKYANARVKKLLGISEFPDFRQDTFFLDLVGKNYHLEPQNLWEMWLENPDSIQNNTSSLFLIRPESESENKSWLQMNSFLVPDDSSGSILLMLTDVTKEMTNKLDLMNFHNMISHKLRTPFHSIITGLNILHDQLSPILDKDQLKIFTITAQGAKRYLDSLESILEYLNVSQSIKNRKGLECRDIPNIIRNICEDIDIQSVAIEMASDAENTRLIFDESLLEIILVKILENSKKFHPEMDPEIRVDISSIDSGDIRIRIGDNGLNLSPQQLLNIWRAYHQIEKKLTGEVEGIGLGLAFVATHLWSVGGRCAAYNQENGPGIIIEIDIPGT